MGVAWRRQATRGSRACSFAQTAGTAAGPGAADNAGLPADIATKPKTTPAAAAPCADLSAAQPAVPPTRGMGLRTVLLITMALWGANLSLVKWLTQSIDPLVVSMLRMVFASVVLVPLSLPRRTAAAGAANGSAMGWPQWPRVSRRQWLGVLGSAVLMVYLNQLCFTLGVQRTAAANAALIIALNPLASALMAAGLLGDRLTPRRVAGVLLGFAGVAAVVLNKHGAAFGAGGVGDLLMLGAVVTWVSGGVLVQRLAQGLDTAFISGVNTWLGMAMLVLHVALDPANNMPAPASLSMAQWLGLMASGVLATAVGALVWNHALMRLGVARTALYAYWVPIFGVLFAVSALGEPLSVWHVVGLAAVLGGTWLGTRR
jgi:drug/metabolite transporter (DMT)-like permease